MGLFAAGLVVYFLLALLIFFGSNWARIAAMTYSALIIVVSAVDFFNGGPQVSLRNNLLGLALDILVVLALSSKASRLWARRPRAGSRASRTRARTRARRGGEGVLAAGERGAVDAPNDDTIVR
ncbi:hypothetical protein [Leifsonia xyli]|uniref:hypothetical protein n=1 Tax=Leifsonia xyli TaxID=1575 RepID=UPI003D67F88B